MIGQRQKPVTNLSKLGKTSQTGQVSGSPFSSELCEFTDCLKELEDAFGADLLKPGEISMYYHWI
jgi:hypothetical protein